jgi:hypothetical protein
LPANAAERSSVLDSIAEAMAYINFVILNPVQRMWARLGLYSLPRLGTILRAWKQRAQDKWAHIKQATVAAPKAKEAEDAGQPAAKPQPESEFVT